MAPHRDDLMDALANSPLADHDGLDVVEEWLNMQPGPEAGGHMVVSASGDVQRVVLYSAGPAGAYAPTVGAFLADGGATEEELNVLASAGEGLEAGEVGSWIELTGPDGLDAGWYFPVNLPVAKARNFAPRNAVSQALADWARRCGAHECAQLRRSVDPDAPSAELTIMIPGEDPAHELKLVEQGFHSVGAPWFAKPVDTVIRSAGSLELLLVVSVGGAGLNACGVLVPEPTEEMLDTLAGVAPRADLEATDDFEATLDVDLPGMIGCFQYPWGMGLERFYSLG